MTIRRLTASAWSLLAACLIAAPLLAQEGQKGDPGPQGTAGPPGPSGTTILGLDQTTALIAGGLVLAVIVILAIVSMSNRNKTA